MRCYWPAQYMDADVIELNHLDGVQFDALTKYDAVVFQKHGVPELQKWLLEQGKQVWMDQCDPMWWFSPEETGRIMEYKTGVVVSSQNLGDDFNKTYGERAYLIHDRMELSHYNRTRQHDDVDPVRFIWFGASMNRLTIYGAWANLSRLAANGYNIELSMMDDRGGSTQFRLGTELPTYQVQWSLEREVDVLTAHDIALLPPYPGPWGEVKSANKKRTAGACGLPVTSGFDYDEMVQLVEDAELRKELGARGRKDVEDLWQVEQSAAQWERLLAGEEI